MQKLAARVMNRFSKTQELRQFATRVVNFSSEYGSGRSYTASNLAGDPHIYPNYGDYTGAFVLRTYGRWWNDCPSAAHGLKKANEQFQSEDFVELEYSTPVIPTEINIYETYNPGAVVRILACNSQPQGTKPGEVEWVTLWSGSPQCLQIPAASRIFSPALKRIDFASRLLRLEFNSNECQYYTELDAVELVGKQAVGPHQFRDRAIGFEVDLTSKLLRQLSLTDRQNSVASDADEDDTWGLFGLLPDELIQYILQHLDVVSLAMVAQTCSLMLKNAYDPLLYGSLDLQSHWNTVDNVALETLAMRCRNIRHLNLSWTGGGGQVSENALCSFLEVSGGELRTLRLACCQYVHGNAMATIGSVCKQLQELDLQCCKQLTCEDLLHIANLHSLKRLNLYKLTLHPLLITTLTAKLSLLEHLNCGDCSLQHGQPELFNDFLRKLKYLVSLDVWRCRFVDGKTITAIADGCPELQELDIGWCSVLFNEYFDAEYLCQHCPKIKKLFLTCGRTIEDSHLEAVANYCSDLEQFDILGTNKVSPSAVEMLIQKCKHTCFFDLSFCGQIKEEFVTHLSKKYKKVCFKKSFSD